MKALFSHWSAPSRAVWTSDESFFSSFCLAVLEASEYYEPVLYADRQFVKTVENFGLPFKSINVVDFSGKGVSKSLWSFPNIWAMKEATPPFVHLDNDFLLFDKPPEFSSMLFEREFDISQDENCKAAVEEVKRLENSPPIWNPNLEKLLTCGIVGCKNVEWKNKWIETAFDWMKKTEKTFGKGKNLPHATVFEEHLAASVAEKIGSYSTISNVGARPTEKQHSYVHLQGPIKKLEKTDRLLQNTFRRRHFDIQEKMKKAI
jgi:hypothetical protein